MTTAKLTADVVVFAPDTFGLLHVLLIQRKHAPFEGQWAFPGGHVDDDEDVQDAAHRELTEETALTVESLRLVGTYAAPGRDPRGRYVTFAYVAMLDSMPEPTAQDDAADARWVRLGHGTPELAFDHRQILADARAAIAD